MLLGKSRFKAQGVEGPGFGVPGCARAEGFLRIGDCLTWYTDTIVFVSELS